MHWAVVCFGSSLGSSWLWPRAKCSQETASGTLSGTDVGVVRHDDHSGQNAIFQSISFCVPFVFGVNSDHHGFYV